MRRVFLLPLLLLLPSVAMASEDRFAIYSFDSTDNNLTYGGCNSTPPLWEESDSSNWME